MRLENKVTIVTGSSSGIGRAIALRYANEGAKVVCADLAPQAQGQTLTATHEDIKQAGGEAIFHATDVSKGAQVEAVVRAAVDKFGRLDVMVNNAGVGVTKWGLMGLHLMGEEQWDETMAINAKSVFLGCKYAVTQMLQQDPHPSGDRGWIVNTSSVGSVVAIPGATAYCASKGTVSSITRQAGAEYGPQRIHVNAICPGFTRTPFLDNLEDDPDTAAEIERKHPLGGIGDPDNVARVAVTLASDDARWMTGVCLPVDGGYTAL